ncbi:phosphoribosylanthranilate isomerase [Methanoculleus taiwanensis]|uniref:phosphoribosylanthranilate isomerase n=1 Tax=Methanoculleus taiwanensis TaxID=1550565 RepID=UPI000FFEBCDE
MKICGITTVGDARAAIAAGADAVGVVMNSSSPRSVTPDQARRVFAAVSPFVTTVAVTSTDREEDLASILACRPDAVQVGGGLDLPHDAAVRVLRVLRPGDALRDDCDAVIVDGSHGTGRAFDHAYAKKCVATSSVPVILAGGLTCGNVGEAIRTVRPYAVDVSSGVETAPGRKDDRLMRAFVKICRTTDL